MNPKLIFPFASVVAALALSGCMQQGNVPGMADQKPKEYEVVKGDLVVEVVDTGSINAYKTVEVKSLVGGRLAKLLVDEGDKVAAGQLIAVVDPQQTQLAVDEQKAQLEGARAGLHQREIDLAKRRVSIQNNIQRMKSRVAGLEVELKNQPTLTSESIISAQKNYDAQINTLNQLQKVTQPNTRIQVENAVADAKSNEETTRLDFERQKGLLDKGYVSGKDVEAIGLQYALAKSKTREALERQSRLEAEFDNDLARQRNLVAQSKSELDRAKTNRFQDTLKAEQLKQARQDLIDAQNDLRDINSLEAGKDQQAATIHQLNYSVQDGDRQLRETEVKAPLSGVVSKRLVQVGELVTSLGSFSSGTPIVQIDDRSSLLVKLNINEIDVARMSIGMKSDVQVDAVPENHFSGTVTKIAPAQQAVTGTDTVVKYAVEITLDKVDDRLKSGMSAKCTIKTVNKPNVIKIPINYLGTDEQGAYVMMSPANPKDPKSKPIQIRITTGVKSGTEVEVVSGLKVGAKIVPPKYKGPKRVGMMGPGGGDDDQ